jgi:hypothetical protein
MISLSIPVPAIRGEFGPSLQTFQTQILPRDVVHVLGHDPRSTNWSRLTKEYREIYEYLQRKTSKGRREGTAFYIEDRIDANTDMPGAFPAIALGMVKPPRFEPAKDGCGFPKEVGILQLDLSEDNKRILLDGLARLTGALDFETKTGKTNVFTFPLTIYAPSEKHGELTLLDLGQLFHDFNFLQTPVSTNHAIALDQSDIYGKLASALAKEEIILRYGGVELRAATLGSKSTALVVQRVLLRFVRGACEGRRYQESDAAHAANPNLTRQNLRTVQAKIRSFLEALEANMGKQRFEDRDSLHLTAPGWQVLGLVFHDIEYRVKPELDDAEKAGVIAKLTSIDWSRYNPDWVPMLGEGEIDKDGNAIVDAGGRNRVALSRAGRTTIASLMKYVREKTGLDKLVVEQESTTEDIPAGQGEEELVEAR